MELQQMRRLAADIRIDVIRQLEAFGGGHIGGSMSIADTLAVLYGGLMRVDPQKPNWPQRDRLVMSKGHCGRRCTLRWQNAAFSQRRNFSP